MAIFFPGMIAGIAKDAGMNVPVRADADFSRDVYPHFFVFCSITLGRAISPAYWHSWVRGNADVIAKLSDEQVKKVTLGDLVDLGVELSCP